MSNRPAAPRDHASPVDSAAAAAPAAAQRPGGTARATSFAGAWIVALAIALGFLAWSDARRIERVRYVTRIAQEPADAAPASLTGYADGTRQLVVPEHILKSYGWVAQTQQMVARREWRVRHVDYDNAPQGRTVFSESLYRWWLGLVAMIDHLVTGHPAGQAVERAAWYADPLLQGLLLLGTTLFVARRFGSASGAVVAGLMAFAFPIGAGFVPGAPDDFALSVALAPWCVLPLLAGIRSGPVTAARWFAAAGLIGGMALWISVPVAVPLLAGIAVGALLVSGGGIGFGRRCRTARADAASSAVSAMPDPSLWRVWALAGAVTILACFLLEFFPAHLADWELRVVHPAYGVGWLGAGDVLYRITGWLQKTRRWRVVELGPLMLGLVALAGVPVLMWKTGNMGFLAPDLLSFRLTKQADGIMAPNLLGWLVAGNGMAALCATLWPVLAVLFAIGMLVRSRGRANTANPAAASHVGAPVGRTRVGTTTIALSLGPVLVAAGYGYFYLRWWQVFDALVLVLAVAVTSTLAGRGARCAWGAILLVTCGMGVGQLVPKTSTAVNVLTLPEVEELVERDLAHWLARRTQAPGGAVVLAPPGMTSSLCFYGGLRGLGTLDWEDREGLAVALRIVISTSREEALALIRKRGVTHIVIPSWDDFFASYLGPASVQNGTLFFSDLDHWNLPPWLRPIPYQLPRIAGFESNSVKVFEVVDDQGGPLAASRLAEYFIEMGQVENAKLSDQLLRRYPADLGTWIARAQLYSATADRAEFATALETILKRVGAGADRFLPFDRRVSLAVVLARGQRPELARVEIERALKDLNETRLRSLTTYSLYHFLGLVKGLGLALPDAGLRALALRLLPAELRERVR